MTSAGSVALGKTSPNATFTRVDRNCKQVVVSSTSSRIRKRCVLQLAAAARLTRISQADCSGTLSGLPDNVTKALAIIRQKVAEFRNPQARPSEAAFDRATAVLVHIYSTAHMHGEGSQPAPSSGQLRDGRRIEALVASCVRGLRARRQRG
jgi:hypothetical protein